MPDRTTHWVKNPHLVEPMVEEYLASGKTRDELLAMGEKYGCSYRSIISKLMKMGLYEPFGLSKKEKTKTTQELINWIEEEFDLSFEFDKNGKVNLQKIENLRQLHSAVVERFGNGR